MSRLTQLFMNSCIADRQVFCPRLVAVSAMYTSRLRNPIVLSLLLCALAISYVIDHHKDVRFAFGPESVDKALNPDLLSERGHQVSFSARLVPEGQDLFCVIEEPGLPP